MKEEEQSTNSAKKLADLKERVSKNSERLDDLKEKVSEEYIDYPIYYTDQGKALEAGHESGQRRLARRIMNLGELTKCDYFPDDEESTIDFIHHRIVAAKPTWGESTLVPSTFSEFHDNAAACRVLSCGCSLPNGVDDGKPHTVLVKLLSETVEKKEGKRFSRKTVTERKFRGRVVVPIRDHNGDHVDDEEFTTEVFDRKAEAAVAVYRVILRENPRWFSS